MRHWLALLRPGDWISLLLGLALVLASFPLLWRGGIADRAIVRSDGRVVAEIGLDRARRLDVAGPLGTTVIDVQPGRARVLADPGPRQYCVRQGWLTTAGAVAICAPNHVTLMLSGRSPRHDSLAY